MSWPSLSLEKRKRDNIAPLSCFIFLAEKKKLLSISLSHEMLIVFESAIKCCLMIPLFFFQSKDSGGLKAAMIELVERLKFKSSDPKVSMVLNLLTIGTPTTGISHFLQVRFTLLCFFMKDLPLYLFSLIERNLERIFAFIAFMKKSENSLQPSFCKELLEAAQPRGTSGPAKLLPEELHSASQYPQL